MDEKRKIVMVQASHLRALVAERNVRRLVVHVTQRTAQELSQASASLQAVELLRAHGFHVGFSVQEQSGERSALATLPSWPWRAADVCAGSEPHAPDVLSTIHIVECGIHVSHDELEAGHADLPTVPFPASSSPDSDWTNGLERLAAAVLGLVSAPPPTVRLFGTHLVSARQIFYESASSFCLVNLKPIVPGHILVIPKRCVDRFERLGADEVSDLWRTAQLVGSVVQRHYEATSLTFAIQDGPEAGQTVPHVHIHVIPRCSGDFRVNDDVYDEIDLHERRLHTDNETRRGRSLAEMAAEASTLRGLFNLANQIWLHVRNR